jgi:hypothetical protein
VLTKACRLDVMQESDQNQRWTWRVSEDGPGDLIGFEGRWTWSPGDWDQGRWSWRPGNRGEMVLMIKQTFRGAEEMQVLGGYIVVSL